MRLVVGAEVQGVQQARHHAAVVGAVGGADDRLHVLAVGRAGGLPFLDQVAQRLLVDDRVDHLLDDAVGLGEGGLGQLEQQAVLAGDALQVLQEFSLDASLGPGADAVDRVQEQVHQGVREFALAQMAEDGQQRQPERRRVPPQFVGRFHGQPLPVGLKDFGRDAVEQVRRQAERPDPVQLGDLLQEAFQVGGAGVGEQSW